MADNELKTLGLEPNVSRIYCVRNRCSGYSIITRVIFGRDDPDGFEVIPSMKGQHRIGVNRLVDVLQDLVHKGLKAVLLFGVVSKAKKVRSIQIAQRAHKPIVRGGRVTWLRR